MLSVNVPNVQVHAAVAVNEDDNVNVNEDVNVNVSAALRGVVVRRHGRDDVADPSKRATGADPQAWRHDEPEDPAEPRPVVELSDAGNDER
jgi:hypothetical protein